MFPLTYGAIYAPPANYQPPDERDLANNTEYPNLNSRDYAKRALNRTTRMHPAWECIDLNEKKHAVIATNKLSGREWRGSLWCFEQLNKLQPEQACFKLQCDTIISKLKFVTKNILLVAFRCGKVQVWSTYSEVRNAKNPYCLFSIGEKCEHLKPIISMDVMKMNCNKAITGSKEGTLKIWDMGSADIFSTHTFTFAHTDAITAIDTSHKEASIFATCSLDKSALLWDERLTRPATAIYENHNVRFKHLSWASQEVDPDGYLIYLGDEAGYVNTLDLRIPKKIMNSEQYFERPIRKIQPNNKLLAVIADTNVVKISNASEHNTIYENGDSQNFIRDCIWYSDNELFSIGYEGKMRKHKVE